MGKSYLDILAEGGGISGRVTDESGVPISDIWVDACEESVPADEWGSYPLCKGAATNELGSYTIPSLQPGNYRLVIWGDESFTTEFYNAALSYYEATLVPVIGGQTSGNIDFVLSAPEPTFTAWPNEDYIDGWEWTEGNLVTLTIDDPGTGPGADYTDSQTVTIAEWDPNITHVQFNFYEIFDLRPGFTVTLTDIQHVKSHTVTDLTNTAVDPNTDVVFGTAAPGTHVYVWVYGEFQRVDRHEIADGSGFWMADFSVPGDEAGEVYIFDILPETGGESNQIDDDGDATQVNWWGAY